MPSGSTLVSPSSHSSPEPNSSASGEPCLPHRWQAWCRQYWLPSGGNGARPPPTSSHLRLQQTTFPARVKSSRSPIHVPSKYRPVQFPQNSPNHRQGQCISQYSTTATNDERETSTLLPPVW